MYYEMSFFVSSYRLCFEIYFAWYKYCYPSFFFHVHFLGIFFSIPSLSVCVDVLYWGGSLVGSICVGHVLLSTQLPYIFWLELLIHLHLILLLIGIYSLPFYFLPTCVPLFISLFLHLLKAFPLAYLSVLVWWQCILWAFFCLGNSFHLPF